MAVCDPTTPDEVWYPVPGCPGYEISTDLRVRSFHRKGWRGGISRTRWRLVTIYPLSIGYLVFHVRVDGKARTIYLHHVIAELAYGPRRDGDYVRHFDDNKENNYSSNLCIGDQAANVADALRNGLFPLGEQCVNAKLDPGKVREIRRLIGEGMTQRAIAARYGISQANVAAIKSGKVWSHVE